MLTEALATATTAASTAVDLWQNLAPDGGDKPDGELAAALDDAFGSFVLTYAVAPDPSPQLPATPLTAPAVICSGDPIRPTPPDLHAHHIAAHAVRHLAYLADTDPAVAATDVLSTHELWHAIRAIGPQTPAAVHETAHHIAEHRAAG